MKNLLSLSVRSDTERTSQRGQILLVIVLLMVVVLTVGLSLATRSITNLRQTSEEDSSQRAFSAAEVGVQVALKEGETINTTNFAQGTTYQATIKTTGTQDLVLNSGRPLTVNEPVDVWLSDYPNYITKWNDSLNLYWGKPDVTDPCQNAAFELVMLSAPSNNLKAPTLTHYAYDPCSTRFPDNNFTSQGITASTVKVGGNSYRYSVTLPAPTNGILLRIIPLYVSSPFAVSADAGSTLPVQGKIIESLGVSGETQRKIVVVQSYPTLPLEAFPFVLFTPSSL